MPRQLDALRPPPRLSFAVETDPEGRVRLSLRHDDGATVFSCTSSYSTTVDMSPESWKQVIEAIEEKLGEVEAQQCGMGLSEEVPPCGRADCAHCARF